MESNMGYYLFAILPNICGTIVILLGILTIPLILLTVAYVLLTDMDKDDETYKLTRSVAKWFYPLYFALLMLNMLIPSQKQLAFIIAAPYIVENEDLQQAGKNTTEIIKLGTEYLKEILNDSNGTDNKTGEH